MQVLWAKVRGFSPWPGRLSSKYEEIALAKKIVQKEGQVAVTFFENSVKRYASYYFSLIR